ncbi:MAG TPA: pyruvate dehydrogenase complex dihydrolipoamide acetyltransferase [Gemmatimonadaceae bacterium]|nr:pyruvate dehydrogenase complex dihydrolipoamide acetyltransferase [Gemmatimonadaceae bacterium]
MATKVVMEALSPTMEEGRLVKWLKNEGDQVKSGDVLAEVETDKAIMELVARGDGVLRKRLIQENAAAPVGTLIAVIAGPDEKIDELVAEAPAAAETKSQPAAATVATGPPAKEAVAPAPPQQPAPRAPQPASGAAAPSPEPGASSSERTKSSPLARRLAAERGLDLTSVSGSGPGGRIVKRDVESARAPSGDGQRRAPTAPGEDYRDTPLTQIRKTIARRLAESIGPIPTFYLTAEFDMERVAEMRSAMAEMGEEYKVSFNDIVLKAVATALAQHPECNAHWLGDAIRYWNRVHIGMAVAIEDGLITPVIFDADRKRLSEIAREARELAGRARDRRLKPDEYTGSTFSVSNLGMFGIDHFTAIINPPEAGILAIGAIEPRPVVHNDAVIMRRRMRVTMSCDHRVIDGATGAKFLQTLRRLIENPLMLVY